MSASDDENLRLLVGLYVLANGVNEARLWSLIECAYQAGVLDGIGRTEAIMRRTGLLSALPPTPAPTPLASVPE